MVPHPSGTCAVMLAETNCRDMDIAVHGIPSAALLSSSRMALGLGRGLDSAPSVLRMCRMPYDLSVCTDVTADLHHAQSHAKPPVNSTHTHCVTAVNISPWVSGK